jgi:hypothetical protein
LYKGVIVRLFESLVGIDKLETEIDAIVIRGNDNLERRYFHARIRLNS